MRSSRVRRPMVLAAAAVALVAASVAGVLPFSSGDDSRKPAYAAGVLAVAESNERLLLRDWTISGSDGFEVEVGELMFSDGTHMAQLRWGPASDYKAYLADRSIPGEMESIGEVTLLGRRGHMFRYRGSEEYTTIVEPEGRHHFEFRAAVGSEQAYRDLLDKLYAVDVDTWLAAIPDAVLSPEARAATLDEVLVGVPLPPGVDEESLEGWTIGTTRYQMAAKVTGVVVCGWYEQWLAAMDNGDESAAAEAVAAVSSSRQWAILNELADQGDHSELVWSIADAMVNPAASGSGRLTRDDVFNGFGCPGAPNLSYTVPTESMP